MRMTGRFNAEEAFFLASAARRGDLVTYGEFAGVFGGIPQGQGGKLTEMGERLRAHKLPLLPVLVVNANTRLPSSDAVFYARLRLEEADLRDEQQRCFDYDWTHAPFWKDNE